MKKCLLFLLLVLALGSASAQTSNLIKARQAALAASGANDLQLLASAPKLGNIFCFAAPDGRMVIASADSRLPILGYGSLPDSPADFPPALAEWLHEMDLQLALGLTDCRSNNGRKDLPDTVAPLITSTWSQYGMGYNSMVPADDVIAADSTMARLDGHPTVGCVALAMAQVMRYWGYPLHGSGSNAYTYDNYNQCWRYGYVSADFGSATYNYDLMPDRLDYYSSDTARFEVAQLLFHCGVAAFMNYNADCQGSSGSNAQYQLQGLQYYFGYNSDAYLAQRYQYSASDWHELLCTEVAEGRPVLMAAHSLENEADSTLGGGHAFIIDGYDANGLVHVNWGWGGACDGYYDLPTLRPLTQYRFAYNQMILAGLDTNRGSSPVLRLADDLTMETDTVLSNGIIRAHYAITNTGGSIYEGYVGTAVYGLNDGNFYGYVNGHPVSLLPDDTIQVDVHQSISLPVGRYQLVMQYNSAAFSHDTQQDITQYFSDPVHQNTVRFVVVEGTETAIDDSPDRQPTLFPNPASDMISLHQLPDNCTVSLSDMQGRTLIQQVAHGHLSLSLANIPHGIYLISVRSEHSHWTQKLIVR